ncbi:MAG: HEAT repeat domain-containing protein [Anaerolineae bacterium]|nr:HEAT repeat domain-containing protein [Anaerolineae bacterium]
MTKRKAKKRQTKSRSVRQLCRALHHRNALTRRQAALELGERGDPAGVDCLSHALRHDRDSYVRREAFKALKAIGSESAVDRLIEAMFSASVEEAPLAAQALTGLESSRAALALDIRTIISRNNWDAFQDLPEEAIPVLSIVLQSEQYANWPSAKRQHVLTEAVNNGVIPPTRFRKQLANIGLYRSGVHTLGDLLRGLRHSNTAVRIAAIDRLASNAQFPWIAWLLKWEYRRAVRAGSDQKLIAALIRGLEQAGDASAIDQIVEQTGAANPTDAREALHLLGEIASPKAVEALFWFIVNPPAGHGNVGAAWRSIETIGSPTVDRLHHLIDHDTPAARQQMVEVISRSGHTDTILLLVRLSRDNHSAVQEVALNALAAINTDETADTLFELAASIPQAPVIAALATMTCARSLERLRQLDPNITTLGGVLLNDNRQPVQNAAVQVVQEHLSPDRDNWQWKAISPRALTGSEGGFYLAITGLNSEPAPRLKVNLPLSAASRDRESFFADIRIYPGEDNQLQARIDRFLDRLSIQYKRTLIDTNEHIGPDE